MSYLIWDFDGTLAYRETGAWTASLCEVLERYEPRCGVTLEALRPSTQQGFPWHQPDQPHPQLVNAEAWWRSLQPVFEAAYRSVGFNPLRASELAAYVRPVYLDLQLWRCYDDTIQTLTLLADQGWRHVLLTNHVPELPDLLAHLGLAPLFIGVFNSAQTGYEKPHRRAFELVLEAYAATNAAWMIGDSYQADIEGAAAVGIPGILVRHHDPRAQRYCGSLREVPDMIARQRHG